MDLLAQSSDGVLDLNLAAETLQVRCLKENDFSESLDSVYSKGLAKSSVSERLGTKKAPV